MTIGWLIRPLASWERLLLGILGVAAVVPLHDIAHVAAAILVLVVVLLVLQYNRVSKLVL